MPAPEVHAAGGVLVRHDHRTAVVHRADHEDWTLPKGRLRQGEQFADGALRQARERTGLDCVLGAELHEIEYDDDRGRPKTVRYWLMTAPEGEFAPSERVDELRWLTVDEAVELLTHESERHLIRWAEAQGAFA